MRFLFWNTNNNENINPILCDIIEENQIDIVLLAEYKDILEDLIYNLQIKEINMHSYVTIGCDRLVALGKKESVQPGRQDSYYTMQIIDNDYLLCGVHIPSKLYADNSTQTLKIQSIVHDIESSEELCESKASIVVGDFNQNPYEGGCLGALGFHGIPVADEASGLYRKISGERKKMFYNPMWNLLGDFKYPPGTYYYKSSLEKTEFWNIFDQVILRPQLRSRFVDNCLEIITKTKNTNLMDKKNHPSRLISDHFPIIFEIRDRGEVI